MSIKQFEQKVLDTINKYSLCSKKDKVIVACSGGKDSMTVLYLLNKFGYKVEGMMIDLLIGDWSKRNLENAKRFCLENGIKLHVIDIKKEFGYSIPKIKLKIGKNVCRVCGVIKRWLINKKARELKGTKLVTGHNLDDESETILMNLLKGNLELMLGMGPLTGFIRGKKFVPRVKPLYFCLNSEVEKYSKVMKFPVIYEPCPYRGNGFRVKVRRRLNEREKKEPKVKENIAKCFLKVLPALRKSYIAGAKMNYCKLCGEPSRGEVCKVCELVKGK